MTIVPFETHSTRIRETFLITVQAPVEDVDRIMECVTALAPLTMGAYDHNAFVTATGVERHRPRKGAAAGSETAVRQRPGVAEIGFEIDQDPGLVEAIIEAVFQVHSYQEPVIRVQPILSCRSKGLDDSANPNRWWNTAGDWKKNGAQAAEDHATDG